MGYEGPIENGGALARYSGLVEGLRPMVADYLAKPARGPQAPTEAEVIGWALNVAHGLFGDVLARHPSRVEAEEAEEREARDLATAPSLTPSDGAWEAATEAWRARWAELRNRRRST